MFKKFNIRVLNWDKIFQKFENHEERQNSDSRRANVAGRELPKWQLTNIKRCCCCKKAKPFTNTAFPNPILWKVCGMPYRCKREMCNEHCCCKENLWLLLSYLYFNQYK